MPMLSKSELLIIYDLLYTKGAIIRLEDRIIDTVIHMMNKVKNDEDFLLFC